MKRTVYIGFLILGLSYFIVAEAGDKLTHAPNFTLPTANTTVSLEDFRGKVIYVDFWASWCAPCRQSFPWMAREYDRYADKGFRIIAINLDKQRKTADTFIQSFAPIHFVIAYDPSGKTADAFNLIGMPSSYLINRTGAVVYSHTGFDPKKTETVEKLIEEACSK